MGLCIAANSKASQQPNPKRQESPLNQKQLKIIFDSELQSHQNNQLMQLSITQTESTQSKHITPFAKAKTDSNVKFNLNKGNLTPNRYSDVPQDDMVSQNKYKVLKKQVLKKQLIATIQETIDSEEQTPRDTKPSLIEANLMCFKRQNEKTQQL